MVAKSNGDSQENSRRCGAGQQSEHPPGHLPEHFASLVRTPFASPLQAMRALLFMEYLRKCMEHSLDLHADFTIPALRRELGLTAEQIDTACDDLARADLLCFGIRSGGWLYCRLMPKALEV
jgi:hypothetical protein